MIYIPPPCFGISPRSISVLLRDALAWWPRGEQPIPKEEQHLNFTLLLGQEAGQEWLQGAGDRGGDAVFSDDDCEHLPFF